MKRSEIIAGTEVACWSRDLSVSKDEVMSGRKAIHGMILGPPQRLLYTNYTGSRLNRSIDVHPRYGEKAERVPVIGSDKFMTVLDVRKEEWDTLYLIPPTNFMPWAKFLEAAAPRIEAKHKYDELVADNKRMANEMNDLVVPSVHRMIPSRPVWRAEVSAYGTPYLTLAPIRPLTSFTVDTTTIQRAIGKRKYARYQELARAIKENQGEMIRLNSVVRW